jgi:hypothetical protein
VQQIADPDEILLHQWLVETEIAVDPLDIFRRRVRAEQGCGGIAGN